MILKLSALLPKRRFFFFINFYICNNSRIGGCLQALLKFNIPFKSKEHMTNKTVSSSVLKEILMEQFI